MGPPEALILSLCEKSSFSDFIETGTYLGDTAAWAAGHFSRVTTIELSERYYQGALKRFRSQANVRALYGHSAAILREIVPLLENTALFWLDAHWSGLDTAGHEDECPLLNELTSINASSVTHTVLVDDARLFSAPPPRPHRAELWPDLSKIVSALSNEGRRYVVVFEDVFIAVPSAQRQDLSARLQDSASLSRTDSRLVRWWRRIQE